MGILLTTEILKETGLVIADGIEMQFDVTVTRETAQLGNVTVVSQETQETVTVAINSEELGLAILSLLLASARPKPRQKQYRSVCLNGLSLMQLP